MVDIAANLIAIEENIADAARSAGRNRETVTLVAVGKAHPGELSRLALAAGHTVFGENRVQEAETKWPTLKAAYPDAQLHLIGPLQTNKVRHAVALFDVIETVDRPKLAAALAKEMARLDNCSEKRIECFVQINTGAEPQKAGVMLEDADAFIESCCNDHGLWVTGLMCIPPAGEEPSLHFALLRKIAERHGLKKLSMGMSADYEIAIAFGATHVRVGSAIFGDRPPR